MQPNLPAVIEEPTIKHVVPELVQTVRVITYKNIFGSERKSAEYEAGGTVADLLREAEYPFAGYTQVYVNENLVPFSEFERFRPQPGNVVSARRVPSGGGGANKQANGILKGLMLVASIVVNIIPGVGQALSLMLMLLIAVVGMVGTLIINALIPPPKQANPSVSSAPAAFSISGNANQLAPYSAMPKVYAAARKVSPQLGATPYTEVVGEYEYLHQIFILGYGPMDISQLKLGDSIIDKYESVEWELRLGFPDDAPLTLYQGSVTQDDINILLAEAPNNVITIYGWQQQTTGTDADEIGVDITFPVGLLSTAKGNGAHNPIQVSVQIRYAPTGTTTWVMRPTIIVNTADEQPFKKGARWTVERGQYDVQVQVKNVVPYKGDTVSPMTMEVNWTALRTIRATPPFTMNGLAMMAIRIRASHQLSGPISNLNVIVGSILPSWNGSKWDSRAGAWEYDYDNVAGGASNYDLDSLTPHTATSRTGTNQILNEIFGTGNGTTKIFSHTLASLPIQPGTFSLTAGVNCPVIDDGLGNLHADMTLVPIWVTTFVYAIGNLVRRSGNAYIALAISHGADPLSNPSKWVLAVTAGAINYTTGAVTGLTYAVAPLNLVKLYCSYIQNQFTNVGKALTIKTASGSDGASVASKSISVHQDPVDGEKGELLIPISYTVSGWYKASSAISHGIKMVAYFADTEGFDIADAISSATVVLIANGSATTSWQQVTGTVTAPPAPKTLAADSSFYMRLVVYHNPDAVGGVTVYWDDIKAVRASKISVQINEVPNPSFDFAGEVTANPADHYRDALQCKAFALAVDDSLIDLPALELWHNDCVTNNRLNNMILDQQQTFFDALKQIAALGRASYARNDGVYSIIQDQPQTTPVQHFTPRNSNNFKALLNLPLLPGALKVRFINPGANWAQDERLTYWDGFDASNTTLFETLDLSTGCTDPDQAWREGRYHLAQAYKRPFMYQLNTSVDNLRCTRGDLVYVSYDVPQWGLGNGRIKSVQLDGSGNCTGFTADEFFTFVYASDYCVRVRRGMNGASLILNVVNPVTVGTPATGIGDITDVSALTDIAGIGTDPIGGAAVTNVIVFDTPIPSGQPFPSDGDLMMFGLQGFESVKLLITKIVPTDDLNAGLIMVAYDPTVYTADSGTPPPFNYGGITNPQDIPPVVLSVNSSDGVLVRQPDGSMEARIVVSLAKGTLDPKFYAAIGCEFRRSALDKTTNGQALYDVTVAYVIGDTVTDTNGVVWICVEPNTNKALGSFDGSGNPYWTLTDASDPWVLLPNQPYGTTVYLQPVSPGVAYDIALRYVHIDGSVTQWTVFENHQVVGPVIGPDDVATLSGIEYATGGGLLVWSPSEALSFDHYEVRVGNTSFATATVVADTASTQLIIGQNVAPGAYKYWVAVVDTSGNFSTNPISVTLTTSNQVVTSGVEDRNISLLTAIAVTSVTDVLPSSGALQQIWGVTVSINDATFPVFFTFNFTLSTAVSVPINFVFYEDDSFTSSTLVQMASGQVTTDATGTGTISFSAALPPGGPTGSARSLFLYLGVQTAVARTVTNCLGLVVQVQK